MTDKQDDVKYIEVTPNGPYLVFGLNNFVEQIIVPDDAGDSWEYKAGNQFKSDKSPATLCRCGNSKHKPFCDGSHATADWDPTETASFEPILDEAEPFAGPNLTLMDNEKYCAFARFCDAKGRVWNLVMEGSDESDKLATREACNCPAGRLMMFDNSSGEAIEPKLDKAVDLIEDVPLGVSGPLWVKGGIKVMSAKGKPYEIRNRQTLCRCGASGNKPFCDGSHARTKFKDDLPIPPKAKKKGSGL